MKKVTAFQSLNGKLFATELEALIEDRRAKLEKFVNDHGVVWDESGDIRAVTANQLLTHMDELTAILTR